MIKKMGRRTENLIFPLYLQVSYLLSRRTDALDGHTKLEGPLPCIY